MKCDRCQQRPATVHMTQIINGAKTETNLCEVCAQEDTGINFGHEPKWLLQNIFADLFNQQPLAGHQAVPNTRIKPAQCESCGFTDSQFSRVGKLGCPQCYQVFENKLDQVLRRVHGNPRHSGKIPKRTGGTLGIRKEIEKLKLDLQEAVSREEYEKAAEIRDKIRSLENEIS
ncbi:MAG: UvrB/UvrC motif-containing protein [Thermincola sp.]|nr:UvrB/UvrC motif-containing protein [Thermincola sp.]MDT3704899.1 UvrB/UvrC motif-containing protein [Thermincola sp.]